MLTKLLIFPNILDEYNMKLDIFHVEEILNFINNKNSISKEEPTIIDKNSEKEKNNILSFMNNPVIKLTDFGCIRKNGATCQTVQTRYYRSPEII